MKINLANVDGRASQLRYISNETCALSSSTAILLSTLPAKPKE